MAKEFQVPGFRFQVGGFDRGEGLTGIDFMTLTQALANFGFFAEAAATKPQVSGAARIGDASLKKEWADADIAHAFKVVATAAGDVVTLGS